MKIFKYNNNNNNLIFCMSGLAMSLSSYKGYHRHIKMTEHVKIVSSELSRVPWVPK